MRGRLGKEGGIGGYTHQHLIHRLTQSSSECSSRMGHHQWDPCVCGVWCALCVWYVVCVWCVWYVVCVVCVVCVGISVWLFQIDLFLGPPSQKFGVGRST